MGVNSKQSFSAEKGSQTATMADDKIKYKLEFQDMRKEKACALQNEIKRIDMISSELGCSFTKLYDKIESEFADHQLKRHRTGVRITYKDNDGDWVTLENKKDLEIAIEEASGQIVHIRVIAYDRW